jgi:four helix bundle protein
MPGRIRRIRSYRDLDVWQKGVDLADHCYQLTRDFPTEKRYGLSSQIRRAAVSIPANIAEGHGRSGRGEYLHHLSIARSLCELETLLLIAERQHFAKAEVFRARVANADEIGRMLFGLITSVAASSARGVPEISDQRPETKDLRPKT